jgi:hypothetical protein
MGDKPKTKFALGDYVEVSERIAAWFEAYPDGRIETELVSMTDKLVVTKSRCYRTNEINEQPAGIGHSMLGIPGKTPYTKDSELENCETSSVGRALVMAGIPSKSIASGHEIRNKRMDEPKPEPKSADVAMTADELTYFNDAIQQIASAKSLDELKELVGDPLAKKSDTLKTKLRGLYTKRVGELKSQTSAA